MISSFGVDHGDTVEKGLNFIKAGKVLRRPIMVRTSKDTGTTTARTLLGRKIGQMDFATRRTGGGRVAGEINDVQVRPEFRRRGVATAMHRNADKRMRAYGGVKHGQFLNEAGLAWAKKTKGKFIDVSPLERLTGGSADASRIYHHYPAGEPTNVQAAAMLRTHRPVSGTRQQLRPTVATTSDGPNAHTHISPRHEKDWGAPKRVKFVVATQEKAPAPAPSRRRHSSADWARALKG